MPRGDRAGRGMVGRVAARNAGACARDPAPVPAPGRSAPQDCSAAAERCLPRREQSS
jgi:hypothetical protein